MRKLVFLIGLLPFVGNAQNAFKIIEETPSYIVLEYTFSDYKLNKCSYNNETYHTVSAANTVSLLQRGNPELCKSSVAINIPAKGKPSLEIVSEQFTMLHQLNILPSKGSLKRNVNPAQVPYTFGETYSTNQFFPAQQATLASPFVLRNERGIVVSVSPFAYNPLSKELKVYSYLKVKINFNTKTKGANEFVRAAANTIVKEEQELYENKFINYNTSQYTPIQEQGSMLVICGDNFLNTIKPFVDWKNQKGIKTTLVPISTIGNNQTNIYNFIQTYYSGNPDLLYLLFVGDHEDINAGDAGMSGSEVKWSDTYYTFLNGGDHYPELFVGRFSGATTSDIQTMVDRTLEYEKTPATGNWCTTAIGIGSGEGDGYGDDGEADWQHERNMGIKLLNWGYTTFYEFFDGYRGGNDAIGDPTTTMVSNQVNNGASLFLYTGHGWEGGCATSNYSSTEVAVSTNNGKYPFAVSVACNNGTFTNGTCFAEEFVRAKNNNGPTGAIACSGSSILMAWAEPMDVQDEIVDILTDQYTGNKKHTLGGLFYNGGLKMLDDYANTTAEEVMETWVLFGDPSCVIRTQVPAQITATHDFCYTSGAGSITINSPDEGALVALSMNDTLFGTAYVQAGSASVPYSVIGTSPLTLTISAYNKLPLQFNLAPCAVGLSNAQGTNSFLVYPNPAHNEITVQTTTGNYELKLMDALGRAVFQKHTNTPATTIDLRSMAKGFYTLQLISAGKQYTQKVLVD